MIQVPAQKSFSVRGIAREVDLDAEQLKGLKRKLYNLSSLSNDERKNRSHERLECNIRRKLSNQRLSAIDCVISGKDKGNTIWECNTCHETIIESKRRIKTGNFRACSCIEEDVQHEISDQNLELIQVLMNSDGSLTGIGRYQCSCGKITEKLISRVESGACRSCGCLRARRKNSKKMINLFGVRQPDGCLTAIARTKKKDSDILWLAICDHNNTEYRQWIEENCQEISKVLIRAQQEKKTQLVVDFFRENGWNKPVFKQISRSQFLNQNPKSCGCLQSGQRTYPVKIQGTVVELDLPTIAARLNMNLTTLRYRLDQNASLKEAAKRTVGGRAYNAKNAPLVFAFADLLTQVSFDTIREKARLSIDEADVLSKRFLGETWTLESLGELYGKTKERIRQIENEALEKVNGCFNLVDFSG